MLSDRTAAWQGLLLDFHIASIAGSRLGRHMQHSAAQMLAGGVRLMQQMASGVGYGV